MNFFSVNDSCMNFFFHTQCLCWQRWQKLMQLGGKEAGRPCETSPTSVAIYVNEHK